MAQHYKIQEWESEPWYNSALIQIAQHVVFGRGLTEVGKDYFMEPETEHVYLIDSMIGGVLDKENTHIKMKDVTFEVHVGKGKIIKQIYVPL